MLARDVMTIGVQTVGPDATLDDAIAIMDARHISGVPVVDADGALIGILTEGDLLRRVETATEGKKRRSLLDLVLGLGDEATAYVRSHSRHVSDLMTPDVVAVEEETPLADVVALMEKRRIRRVPVVREGQLVGIVSRLDLVRAIGRKLAEDRVPHEPVADTDLELRIRAALGQVGMFDRASVAVRVHEGIATIDGVIHDERLRPAIRVAVERVPGVIRAIDNVVFVEPVTGSVYPA